MRCIVTAGPTYEPLDAVRRLTNFSSGRLGCELAGHLAGRGHEVRLLIGEQATWRGERLATLVETFTTTASLRDRLEALGGEGADVVFHAAAVSDFAFGALWRRSEGGELIPVHAGKIPTREGALLAELKPTPKIIAELRHWFLTARLVGWKYEVDGDREEVLRLARNQIGECRTDACVANGPAYGEGFALVQAGGTCRHLPDAPALCQALEREYGTY
jgi:phosphopantothenoylcysteine decarboxylase/phosphopantothenate--cysteine ligase